MLASNIGNIEIRDIEVGITSRLQVKNIEFTIVLDLQLAENSAWNRAATDQLQSLQDNLSPTPIATVPQRSRSACETSCKGRNRYSSTVFWPVRISTIAVMPGVGSSFMPLRTMLASLMRTKMR